MLGQTAEQTRLFFTYLVFSFPSPQPSPNLPQISNCFRLRPRQINRIYWIRLISRLRPRTWPPLWPTLRAEGLYSPSPQSLSCLENLLSDKFLHSFSTRACWKSLPSSRILRIGLNQSPIGTVRDDRSRLFAFSSQFRRTFLSARMV